MVVVMVCGGGGDKDCAYTVTKVCVAYTDTAGGGHSYIYKYKVTL